MRAEALSPPAGEHPVDHCQRCGMALAEGQEWCLDCGAARTLLRPPPDWRGPAAIVLLLVVLAVVVLVAVLVSLGG